jgi:8-amino-7-oxononanoate synthase
VDSREKNHRYHAELDAIRKESRWRSLHAWEGAGGVFHHDGKTHLNFSSNDYLNLGQAPSLKAAVVEAMETHGCGATASRLMSGSQTIHEQLEHGLASLTGHETALAFPSGYQANVGVLTSLVGPGSAVFSDALNHASIIDGVRLSRAKVHVYRHSDMAHLEELLAATTSQGRRVIVTDSVFSMDGDLAHVSTLSELAKRYDAVLVVDEAHAIGIWGGGGGLCRHVDVRPDVLIGTLGKALGSGGGFVACDRPYRDLFVNRARSFIYTTGLSPMNAAAALAGVGEIEARPEMGGELLTRARRFQDMLVARGVDVVGGETQILPIHVGDDARVMTLAQSLLEYGIIATGIRPPTVPAGTARLRLSVTLGHDDEVLEQAAEKLAFVILR